MQTGKELLEVNAAIRQRIHDGHTGFEQINADTAGSFLYHDYIILAALELLNDPGAFLLLDASVYRRGGVPRQVKLDHYLVNLGAVLAAHHDWLSLRGHDCHQPTDLGSTDLVDIAIIVGNISAAYLVQASQLGDAHRRCNDRRTEHRHHVPSDFLIYPALLPIHVDRHAVRPERW